MGRRVLVVDDDAGMCEMLVDELESRKFGCSAHTSPEDALSELQASAFDTVLADLNMPGMNGLDLCKQVAQYRPDIPVIVITAFGSMESAIEAIRAGAYDFVTKPFDMDMLALVVDRAVRHYRLTRRVRLLDETIRESRNLDDLIGASPGMQAIFRDARQVAETDSSVLISGETGTGKELLARAIHARSSRNGGPFVPVNCPALPGSLLESELFGHAVGAFTDARSKRKGLFLQANGGTIFLDEIGDLPASLQAKLLRALEERSIRAVGSDREEAFDARIIAATNRDLQAAVAENAFRRDLYFRINVVSLRIPPLRTRGSDVLLLARHFLDRFGAAAGREEIGLSDTVAEKFMRYFWPGNVRELRNVIERGVALTRHDALVMEDLPDEIRDYESAHVIVTSNNPDELVPMAEVEKRYITQVLAATGGNRTTAAKILGLARKTLYRKLQSYGIPSGETGHSAP